MTMLFTRGEGTTNTLCSDSPRKFGFLPEVLYLDPNIESVTQLHAKWRFWAILSDFDGFTGLKLQFLD